MSYLKRTGDLMTADVDAIAHGCNCRGVMGAGVAKLVAEKYGPEMVEEYRVLCLLDKFRPGKVMPWYEAKLPVLFNLATQDQPGPHADINAIRLSVAKMLMMASRPGIGGSIIVRSIGIPRIGSGIGGLDWNDVDRELARLAFKYPEIDLIVYSL